MSISLLNFDQFKLKHRGLTSPRSIEACRRQGIQPRELIAKSIHDIKQENKKLQLGNAGWELMLKYEEEKRKFMIQVLLQERQAIIFEETELFSDRRLQHNFPELNPKIYSLIKQEREQYPKLRGEISSSSSEISYEYTEFIFLLTKLSHLASVEYSDMKLKLGVFLGANLLLDADYQVQMALKDLQPTEFLEDSLQFKLKQGFSIQLESIINNHDVTECMLFMGFFKNQKELFGWNAVPLFENDPDTGEHRLKLGAFQMNMLSPPGYPPPFLQDTRKKSEIEVGFILMTPQQNIGQLPKYNTYVDSKQLQS